jgi:hypothetical protein
MNPKIALTAISLSLVLGGASGALAASKKHNAAHEAYASDSGGKVADPRVNKGSNHEGWCDMDEQCNGWAEWLKDVSEGKLKAQ